MSPQLRVRHGRSSGVLVCRMIEERQLTAIANSRTIRGHFHYSIGQTSQLSQVPQRESMHRVARDATQAPPRKHA
jgi:hypothetical protein